MGVSGNLIGFKDVPCWFYDCLPTDIVLAANRHVDIRPSNQFSLGLCCLPQGKEGSLATKFTPCSQLCYSISKRYYIKHRSEAPPQIIPIKASYNYSFPIMISSFASEFIKVFKKLPHQCQSRQACDIHHLQACDGKRWDLAKTSKEISSHHVWPPNRLHILCPCLILSLPHFCHCCSQIRYDRVNQWFCQQTWGQWWHVLHRPHSGHR